MHLEDFDTTQRYQATVLDSSRLTPETASEEVRELLVEIQASDFQYDIGQNIGVLVPGPHTFGHEYHFRLYSIADTPACSSAGQPLIRLCVRRCFYLDEYSGERYPGIASNYLCDRQPGQQLTLSGPYGLPFEIPEDKTADILMIGMGTGIAPFRAFVKHIYDTLGGWQGKVRLFYGAKSGLEMLYMNDKRNDLANYYDEATFEAFQALSPRPHWGEPIALEQTLERHEQEVWPMINKRDTYVYVTGHEKIRQMLEKAFNRMAGSPEKWQRKKTELESERRWQELIYSD